MRSALFYVTVVKYLTIETTVGWDWLTSNRTTPV